MESFNVKYAKLVQPVSLVGSGISTTTFLEKTKHPAIVRMSYGPLGLTVFYNHHSGYEESSLIPFSNVANVVRASKASDEEISGESQAAG